MTDPATRPPGNPATAYSAPDPARIRSMFAAIATRYDRANDVLSAGVHRRWRRRCVAFSGAKAGDRVLDCATGTGDLAISFKDIAGCDVVGTDFTPEMVELARAKRSDVDFRVADVTALPFDDRSFDVASISFGIRNVGDPRRALGEMARVVRPGGRVVVLEFGQPRGVVGTLYDFYRRNVLARVGGAITGQRDAYEYLESSSAKFPSGEAFVSLMRESAQFDSVDAEPLTFGVAWLYRGVVASA